MDLEEIKDKIVEIKEKVIIDVDKHFNEYIIEDLKDLKNYSKYDYLFINSASWLTYWFEILYELKPIIDELVDRSDNETDYKLFIEGVNLKRIIESEILKSEISLKKEEKVNLNPLLRSLGVKNIQQSKYPWHIDIISNNKEIIKNLHNNLKNYLGYIDIGFKEFADHFDKKNINLQRIKWTGDIDLLIALVQLLYKNNILKKIYYSSKAKTLLILNHFESFEGENLKLDSIKVQLSNIESLLKENNKKFKPIIEMVNNLCN